MKYVLFIPVLVIIAALCSFAPDGSWVNYRSAEGHFSIIFPGKPEESTQDDTTADKIPFKIHFVTYSPKDDEVYIAGWIDMTLFYPKDKDMKEMLEGSRNGAVESMKATDVKTVALNLGEKPYIEFTFAGDSFAGKDRIYIINKFQYSIITMFSGKAGVPPSADKFITSFKIVP